MAMPYTPLQITQRKLIVNDVGILKTGNILDMCQLNHFAFIHAIVSFKEIFPLYSLQFTPWCVFDAATV